MPATSANLGPGFDCLGLALELVDTLVGEVTGGGLEIEVEGEGSDEIDCDETHLVVRSMRADVRCPRRGTSRDCTCGAPTGSRTAGGSVRPRPRSSEGSSSPVRWSRVARPGWTTELALALANRIEGHPDNVAPALLGGFVVSGQAGDEVWAQQSPVDESVSAVVFVPPHGVRTDVARGLLPDVVPHADAAANTGRAALLVAALGGHPAMLMRATEDFLHQQHREAAMPESLALVRDLREAGIAAVISGAGPTVLAFVVGGSEPRRGPRADRMADAPADRRWRPAPAC